MQRPMVPIRAAALQTGISADNIRAWERRYKAVKPQRGKNGRLFSEEDIARLKLLKKAVAEGNSIGQIASLSDEALEKLFGTPTSGWSVLNEDPRTVEPYLDSVFSHIEKYDGVAADRVLGKLAALLTPSQFAYEVMVPLMKRVGQAWQSGQINAAQEHIVSMIVRGLTGTLLRHRVSTQLNRKVVFTTPPNEHHEFGIQIAAILALSAGLEVIYLGPNLPAEETAEVIRKTQACALVLGICPGESCSASSLRHLGKLSTELKDNCRIILGGGPYNQDFSNQMAEMDIWYPPDFKACEARLVALAAND